MKRATVFTFLLFVCVAMCPKESHAGNFIRELCEKAGQKAADCAERVLRQPRRCIDIITGNPMTSKCTRIIIEPKTADDVIGDAVTNNGIDDLIDQLIEKGDAPDDELLPLLDYINSLKD
jgi:hypothetical protein